MTKQQLMNLAEPVRVDLSDEQAWHDLLSGQLRVWRARGHRKGASIGTHYTTVEDMSAQREKDESSH